MTFIGKTMIAVFIIGVVLCLVHIRSLTYEYMGQSDNYGYTYMKQNVRILCWIKTHPSNILTRAVAINATWGPRCDKTLYMSSVHNDTLSVIGLNSLEGRKFLTDKTMRAFQYVYNYHLDDAEWFLATDDDTYAIIENLRLFLSDKDPVVPIYYGHKFKSMVRQGYSSGGSGYVLSREALRRLGEYGHKPSLNCELMRGADDVEIGKCLEKLNVTLGDSRDADGRSRFHCFHPESHLFGKYPTWYPRYDAYGAKHNFISDYAISFHYVSPSQMRLLDFLIYHLRPFATTKDKMLRVWPWG